MFYAKFTYMSNRPIIVAAKIRESKRVKGMCSVYCVPNTKTLEEEIEKHENTDGLIPVSLAEVVLQGQEFVKTQYDFTDRDTRSDMVKVSAYSPTEWHIKYQSIITQ